MSFEEVPDGGLGKKEKWPIAVVRMFYRNTFGRVIGSGRQAAKAAIDENREDIQALNAKVKAKATADADAMQQLLNSSSVENAAVHPILPLAMNIQLYNGLQITLPNQKSRIEMYKLLPQIRNLARSERIHSITIDGKPLSFYDTATAHAIEAEEYFVQLVELASRISPEINPRRLPHLHLYQCAINSHREITIGDTVIRNKAKLDEYLGVDSLRNTTVELGSTLHGLSSLRECSSLASDVEPDRIKQELHRLTYKNFTPFDIQELQKMTSDIIQLVNQRGIESVRAVSGNLGFLQLGDKCEVVANMQEHPFFKQEVYSGGVTIRYTGSPEEESQFHKEIWDKLDKIKDNAKQKRLPTISIGDWVCYESDIW